LFQIIDECWFIDPISARCVLDGFAGARTEFAASASVDIANGAPSGAGATDEIVDSWADASEGLNNEKARIAWSTDGGATWGGPTPVSLPGDRPIYAAPAISPIGDRAYVIYEADLDPWRGTDMTSPRRYRGVFLQASIAANGTPAGWTTVATGAIGDLKATYPGHDIYQERIGDYVYAAARRRIPLRLVDPDQRGGRDSAAAPRAPTRQPVVAAQMLVLPNNGQLNSGHGAGVTRSPAA
jgi:hypothetical protein